MQDDVPLPHILPSVRLSNRNESKNREFGLTYKILKLSMDFMITV